MVFCHSKRKVTKALCLSLPQGLLCLSAPFKNVLLLGDFLLSLEVSTQSYVAREALSLHHTVPLPSLPALLTTHSYLLVSLLRFHQSILPLY